MLNLRKGLLLYGAPGVGKTFSMCALIRLYIMRGHNVERISYDALCVKIRDTFKPSATQSEQDLIRHYQNVEKLFIEDVGTTVGDKGQESDFSLRTFLLILDNRIEHRRPTFITTNKPVDELAKSFDERVASRLYQACEIIPVGGNDKRKATK